MTEQCTIHNEPLFFCSACAENISREDVANALDQKIEDIAGMVDRMDKSTHPADIADHIRAMKKKHRQPNDLPNSEEAPGQPNESSEIDPLE